MDLTLGRVTGGFRDQQPDLVAEAQHDAPVGGTERFDTQPHHLAGGDELIEIGGSVAVQSGRQDVLLDHRCGQRCALQLTDRLHQSLQPPAPLCFRSGPYLLPHRQEAAEHGCIDRLDLGAEHGQRAPLESTQDLGVDPLT
ncbi:MAG: hypothetical protein WED32_02275 [Patescibacteria group bacterium]